VTLDVHGSIVRDVPRIEAAAFGRAWGKGRSFQPQRSPFPNVKMHCSALAGSF